MRARKIRKEWAVLFAKFEESGESIEAFSRRHGVAAKTLRWWRWRLGRSEGKTARTRDVRLLAVEVQAPTPTISESRVPTTLDVVVGDVHLHVEIGTEPGYVAALVAELRRRC
jgi:transposase-like protein